MTCSVIDMSLQISLNSGWQNGSEFVDNGESCKIFLDKHIWKAIIFSLQCFLRNKAGMFLVALINVSVLVNPSFSSKKRIPWGDVLCVIKFSRCLGCLYWQRQTGLRQVCIMGYNKIAQLLQEKYYEHMLSESFLILKWKNITHQKVQNMYMYAVIREVAGNV